MRTKDEIRRAIATRRGVLDPAWRATASETIAKRLVGLDAFASAGFIGLYLAIDGEVALDGLLDECWNRGKRTAIPVFNAAEKVYEMAEVTAATKYETGRYGIREPVAPKLVPMSALHLIAVPGVAFDRAGNRLGRGGGYYDRLLVDFRGATAAVAFDFQLVGRVPVDMHDLPVDLIVTEKEVLDLSGARDGSLNAF